MTRIIAGGRGSGKTLELIRESAASGTYILVSNKQRAAYLFDQAKKMGYHIPYPVTVGDYFRSSKFDGSSIRKDGLCIDDVDDVLRTIFSPIDIKAVTFTKQCMFDLDQAPKIVDSEPWLKANPNLHNVILYYVCPECGEFIFMYRPPDQLCPKCGSKMDALNRPPHRFLKENPYLNKKKEINYE